MFRSLKMLAAAGLVALATNAASAQLDTTFTYQGRLDFQGAPVDGVADFLFILYDSEAGGTQVGPTNTRLGVAVDEGLFTADADFGADAFTGEDRWLHVWLRHPAGTGAYAPLGPRQLITAAPYANHTRGLNVNESGSVGIGTTNPTDAVNGVSRVLHVVGDSTSPSFPGTVGLVLENPVAASSWALSMFTDSSLRFSRIGGSGFKVVEVPMLRIVGGSDIAEPFTITGARPVEPGMVVTIDPDRVGELRLAGDAYDPTVAGIVSGAGGVNTGMTLTQTGSVADGTHPVALTGRVWCWCDADVNGPITAGSMLTTSPTLGHAMAATDRDRAFGATIGKAMSSLESGRGLVLVLVNLQ